MMCVITRRAQKCPVFHSHFRPVCFIKKIEKKDLDDCPSRGFFRRSFPLLDLVSAQVLTVARKDDVQTHLTHFRERISVALD